MKSEEPADAATILYFEPYRQRLQRREAALGRMREFLEPATQELHGLIVELAVSDAWAEWDAGVPEGTAFCFDPQTLRGCPDEAVQRYTDLLEMMYGVLEEG